MRRRLASTLVVAVLLSAAVGCGSDKDSGDDGLSGRDRQVADALADVMGRNLTTENGRTASECTADAIVERLGGDGVVEAGLLTEELDVPRQVHDYYTPDVADAIGDAYVACWDVDAQLEDVRAGAPQLTEKQLTAFGACMRAIPDDVIHDTYYNLSIQDGDQVKAAALGTAISRCQQKLT